MVPVSSRKRGLSRSGARSSSSRAACEVVVATLEGAFEPGERGVVLAEPGMGGGDPVGDIGDVESLAEPEGFALGLDRAAVVAGLATGGRRAWPSTRR